MNKEILNEQLNGLEARNPGLKIFGPKDLQPQETADKLIGLLQAMYVEHGITKNKGKLVDDISNGDVLTWFAQKDGKFIATASLVKQSDGAWELGRAVSLDRGNGVGKKVILEALKFHTENHPGVALTAEVRAAAEFEGIPSGEATQKIFFGTVNEFLPITPFAVAPLFSHGNPLRNENFILSASDVRSDRVISERVAEAINMRSTKGSITRLSVVHELPFRLVIPNDSGMPARNVLAESDSFNGTSLFSVEATDTNMPLIGMLSSNPDVVLSGVDRVMGKEQKPIVLFASLGSGALLAPTQINPVLPKEFRVDIQNIVNRFENIHSRKNHELINKSALFWEIEKNWPMPNESWRV